MIKETFKNEETGGVKVAAIAAGSGQLIANIILSIATQQMGVIVFMCACTVISFVLFYFI
ncbi:Membrane protein [Bacillus thuringiensis serovar indiana]|nr:Membrane protein [Bacillus thuringiensis serovar indiana]